MGSMNLTVRVGQSCAWAEVHAADRASATIMNAAPTRERVLVGMAFVTA
jgi:hypothetical protein